MSHRCVQVGYMKTLTVYFTTPLFYTTYKLEKEKAATRLHATAYIFYEIFNSLMI